MICTALRYAQQLLTAQLSRNAQSPICSLSGRKLSHLFRNYRASVSGNRLSAHNLVAGAGTCPSLLGAGTFPSLLGVGTCPPSLELGPVPRRWSWELLSGVDLGIPRSG